MKFLNSKNILLLGYLTTKNLKYFHFFFRLIYLKVFIPNFARFFKWKHKDILFITPRHSLTEHKYFNFFISDIDLDIVIRDNADFIQILKTFSSFKKLFIFLDWPEIYFEREYESLIYINKSKNFKIIESIRLIRKINWELEKKCTHKIDILKRNRSIKIAFMKISHAAPSKDLTIKFNQLICFDELYNFSQQKELTCFISKYLETNNSNRLIILCDPMQLAFFNSLLPSEEVSFPFWANDLDTLKTDLLKKEILITSSSLKLDSFFNKPISAKINWLNKLQHLLN